MKTLDPLKILAISTIFLVVLYLTSAIIPAAILSLAVFLVLHLQTVPKNLLKLGGIFLFALLIYPLVGGYFTAIIGYGIFVAVLHKYSESRYAFILALLFVIICPVLLIINRNEVAETFAVFAYLFLSAGLIQEVINLFRSKQTC